jgi:hypothetical protein
VQAAITAVLLAAADTTAVVVSGRVNRLVPLSPAAAVVPLFCYSTTATVVFIGACPAAVKTAGQAVAVYSVRSVYSDGAVVHKR